MGIQRNVLLLSVTHIPQFEYRIANMSKNFERTDPNDRRSYISSESTHDSSRRSSGTSHVEANNPSFPEILRKAIQRSREILGGKQPPSLLIDYLVQAVQLFWKSLIYPKLARILFRMGKHVTTTHISKLNNVINYLELGHWFKANNYSFYKSYRSHNRYDLYASIASKIEDKVVLYLEFGVWKGASLHAWSKLLRNPHSLLHGFDSFEGLPETWNTLPKGCFGTEGILPQFDDPRIILHKGWFDETLPSFILPEHERLLLHLDADLYSSTKCVLDILREAICPGTIIIFDEFHDRLHELIPPCRR